MLRNFRHSHGYELSPTTEQAEILQFTLEICKELYNLALQERIEIWKRTKKFISLKEQINYLPEIIERILLFQHVHPLVLKNVMMELVEDFIERFVCYHSMSPKDRLRTEKSFWAQGRKLSSKSRGVVLQKVLWRRYVLERQTIAQLARHYDRSQIWIRQNNLTSLLLVKAKVKEESVVIVADMTFSMRSFGVCVFRAVHLRKNLYWAVGLKETTGRYDECRRRLEDLGFEISAVVVDGTPGIIEVFWDIPIQMCHFQQSAIMTWYLTTRPKLAAGQELRTIVLTMSSTTQKQLQDSLNSWYEQ